MAFRACVVAAPLPEPLRAALVEDADGHAFAPPDPRAGGAFALASLTEPDGAPRRFADWLAGTPEWAPCRPFAPNEASYQRYTSDGRGLPPHRDQRYHVHAIAIATLVGEATFAPHGSAAGDDVVAEWRTAPGQVILLPGWGPAAPGDVRPHPGSTHRRRRPA